MRRIQTSALEIAETFVGLSELDGTASNQEILGMLRDIQPWPNGDEVPWCSAFARRICRGLHLPFSHSLGARTWLKVGTPIRLSDAEPGLDVVIFKRGDGVQPGPEVIAAPGHVAFFRALIPGGHPDRSLVEVVGGNQNDAVTIARYRASNVLGVRRLA